MIDPANVPEVSPAEQLARYILQSGQIRRNDQTVKPDAFIPHPHRVTSVTRHLQASVQEVWAIGQDVATKTGKRLYGRADITAATCLDQRLRVDASPLPGNPNHADISGWPADKPSQKIIAQELAAAAVFIPS